MCRTGNYETWIFKNRLLKTAAHPGSIQYRTFHDSCLPEATPTSLSLKMCNELIAFVRMNQQVSVSCSLKGSCISSFILMKELCCRSPAPFRDLFSALFSTVKKRKCINVAKGKVGIVAVFAEPWVLPLIRTEVSVDLTGTPRDRRR